jgi:hypothetical protein
MCIDNWPGSYLDLLLPHAWELINNFFPSDYANKCTKNTCMLGWMLGSKFEFRLFYLCHYMYEFLINIIISFILKRNYIITLLWKFTCILLIYMKKMSILGVNYQFLIKKGHDTCQPN